MPKLLISMEKKKRFSGRPVEKVRCQGQPSSARAQPMQLLNFCNYNRKKMFKSCAISIVGQI